MKVPLFGLLPEEISSILDLKPGFRGGQIFSSIHRGRTDFASMTDIPGPLREELGENAAVFTTSVSETHEDDDGTKKLLIRLSDGLSIESVLLLDPAGRKTACLSTQVGCGMGCAFCRTGLMGLKRNLDAHEIVEQLIHIEMSFGEVSNVVFMGMGEPFRNSVNVKKLFQSSIIKRKNFGIRRFTISTSGIISEIETLSEFSKEIKFAVSLVSADPETRASLMPVQKAMAFSNFVMQ